MKIPILRLEYTEEEIEACNNNEFSDISEDNDFISWICIAKSNEIIHGYGDGTFKPWANISFIEAVKIIVNTFGYEVESDGVWYKSLVEKLAQEKSIPTTIDSFSKKITRGEMAEMIYRLKENVITKESLTYDGLKAIEMIKINKVILAIQSN